MSNEERWQVPEDRRAGLAGHSTRVHNDGRADAVLYYPGSGSDILNALFAAGAKARYFIFVDPDDLDQPITTHIREKHSRLDTTEASVILTNLKIRSQPAGTWMFSMQGATRFLFHFRMGHAGFVTANPGFMCDIVFEKDFWETSDVVDLGGVLSMLRVGGHYSTNSSIGVLTPLLRVVGLDFVNSYHINGNQYLFRRRTVTTQTWANVSAALTASIGVVQDLICDETSALSLYGEFDQAAICEELKERQTDMLAPFQQVGITVPPLVRNPLCRQIAVKATGAAVFQYIGGIEDAFGG